MTSTAADTPTKAGFNVLSADARAQERAATELAFRSLPKGDLLLGYQRRAVDELFAGTALLVIEKSRRIGLTWGVASWATLKAASAVQAGGQNIWYMGFDKEMTREFVEVCAMWARAYNLIAGEIEEEEVIDEETGKPIQAYSIRMASGFRITGLASVPRQLRSRQGIAILDEAAFHGDVAEVLKSAMAFLIWGGQVVVISTHDGISNPFNVLIDEIKAGDREGKTMRITFADAMADGLYERVALVAETKGTVLPPKEQWERAIRASYGADAAEELDCVPAKGSGALISLEDIIACESEDAGLPELYMGGLCYGGRDVARRRDGQIQLVGEKVGDVLWERDGYRETGQTFAHQDAWFDDSFKRFRMVQWRVDQTGMGEKVVEDQVRKHGASRVVGVLLTGPERVNLAFGLQRLVQQRKIRFRSDPRTRADLMAIKKIGSEESGGIRIINDGDVHADEFWAYALMWQAMEMAGSLYEYRGVNRDGRATGGPKRGEEGWQHPDDVSARAANGTRFQERGAW